jgi:16S rRNA (adenine1518-N6/adenine1519-N6)-dimethyltransferase
MQTKRQIRQLLASAGVTPNRRFGQHFLVDLNLLRLLLDSAQIGSEDVVLEVGCGTGSITQGLAERARHVVAVEVDRTLASLAESQLQETDNIDLIRADVLSSKGLLNARVVAALDKAREPGHGRLLLVSNLPYEAATAVMLNLVRGPVVADEMVVTVQKEVGERMEAGPNSKDYGTLSILLGATGRIKTLRALKPSVFWPPPGVDSVIVRFARDPSLCGRIEDMARFGAVVSLFMGHRRKMLRACAKFAPAQLGGRKLWMELFERSGIDPTQRPEALSPEQYVELANLCGRGRSDT